MKVNSNLIALFLREFGVFSQPLRNTVTFNSNGEIVADLDAIKAYLKSIGYDLEPLIQDADFWKEVESTCVAVVTLAGKLKQITPLVKQTIESIDFPDDIKSIPIVLKELPKDAQGLMDFYEELKPSIDELSKGFKKLTEYCKTLKDVYNNPDLTKALQSLPQTVLNALTYRYLSGKHPALMPILEFLTLATWREKTEHTYNDNIVIVEGIVPSFDPLLILKLCSDPGDWWQATYWPGAGRNFGPTVADVNIVAKKLFTSVQAILEGFGAQTALGLPPAEMGITYPSIIDAGMKERMEGMLTWSMPVYSAGLDKILNFGASLGLLVQGGTDQGPGLFIIPFGDFAFEVKRSSWVLKMDGSLVSNGFKINSNGLSWVDSPPPSNSLTLSLAPKAGKEEVFVLGTASRLEIGTPNLLAEFNRTNNQEFNTSIFFPNNTIVIENPEGNDFLGIFLPDSSSNITINFGLKLGWSNTDGFLIEISGSNTFIINLNYTLFHFIHFKTITITTIPNQVKLALEASVDLPRSVFQPLIPDPDDPGKKIIDPDETHKSKIELTVGGVLSSSKTGFKIAGNTPITSFAPSAILNSGFTISLTEVKLDLSRTKNIAEAIADNRPADFVGVYIKEGIVGFPLDWGHDSDGSTGELYVENLLAGTGGISGTIGLRGNITKPATATDPAERESNPFLSVNFGEKFSASLTAFSITFQQNAILKSSISGQLDLKGFKDSVGNDAQIDIKIDFGQNGDFEISAKEEDGIDLPLHLEKFMTVSVKSLKVGKRSKKVYVAVSGKISFADQGAGSFLSNFLPKDVEIEKLLIWQNGQIELEGGVVTLRKPFKLNLGPVKLTVTALGMGSHEKMHNDILRKYKYVEFSAGISVNPGGVDARGDGIQVFFSIDNDNSAGRPPHVYVRIQSIAIDLVIPGSASKSDATLLLSGYLSMKEPKTPLQGPDPGTEYAGGIDFKLPKMKMGGSADMRYAPKIPSFLIDVSLEISTPIVLGATGMGIYGFRALFGKRYVASKTGEPVNLSEDAEWWQYYKKKVPPISKEGINASKMANKPGFSFGAGVSLATAADGGQAFSSKLFFLLSLPDVFLLQGQAQILKGRIGLDSETDPPFFALIAIDKTSISAALGVNYKITDDGDKPGSIIAVDALIEMAYFWRDSSAWYLNIGRDMPIDRRVRARIFDLFDVYSYFMLSARGIRAGAGASIEKNYNVGPIKASLRAYMDTAGRLNFKRIQIGGSIQIGGNVDIKVCGMGLSAYAFAALAAEAPHPFIVTGVAEACVKVLKKEYCVHFDFTWMYQQGLDYSEIPIITGSVPGTLNSAKALNMMSLEPLDVLCFEGVDMASLPAPSAPSWGKPEEYVIPMDSYIDIEFKKPVSPHSDPSLKRFGGTNSGAEYSEFIAPQRGKSDRVRHDYILDKVEIFSWDPNAETWVLYHVYEAISALNVSPFNLTQSEIDQLHFGFWQVDSPGKYRKLRLMAQHPFSFLRQGTGDTIPEDLGVTNAIFCPPALRRKICVNFDSFKVDNHAISEVAGNTIFQHERIAGRVVSNKGKILRRPFNGLSNALSFNGTDTLELYLPEPMAEVDLLVGTVTKGLTIKYYTRVQLPEVADQTPKFDYILVSTVVKTQAELSGSIKYSDVLQPIVKIAISGNLPTVIEKQPLFCDTSISADAKALLEILNLIAKSEQAITNPTDLTQATYAPWASMLSFLPKPLPSGVKYTANIVGQSLSITLGVAPQTCHITLTLLVAGMTIVWNNIERFQNLRPDPKTPSSPGANYTFLIDAVVDKDRIVTLQGQSRCIPIFHCYEQYLNFFHQLCYQTVLDFQFNQNRPSDTEVLQHNQNMADAINKTLWPVWRPDTTFAIRVKYTDQVFRESASTPEKSYSQSLVLGFKTQGPLGHYHEFPTGENSSAVLKSYQDLEAQDKEDAFKLTALKYYIDFPNSYPDPSGNILNSKPLYYKDPELRLFYIYPHVYQFYQNWESYNGAPKVNSSLVVAIKDPTEVPYPSGSSIPSNAPLGKNDWEKNDFPHITPDMAALTNMISNGESMTNPCPPKPLVLKPNGINNLIKPGSQTPLEPLKLYTALFKAVYQPERIANLKPIEREVHRYAFQTSRYEDFSAHINSYVLQRNKDTDAVEREAVYVLDVDPAVIQRAKTVLDGSLPASDPLYTEATLVFDQLIDRVLEIKGLEPAEFLQFNIIRSKADGVMLQEDAILGILIRSPEPFNDPRMPEQELKNGLRVNALTSKSELFSTYYSKDNCSIFITNAFDPLALSPLHLHLGFQFHYLLYDGKEYGIKDSVAFTLDFEAYL